MVEILTGDSLTVLRTLPSESVHCVVTSPPYWGLRDYGVEGQMGLEKTPGEYIAKMVEVFREVRRVLRSDGTCWVNIGDSYAGSGKGGNPEAGKQSTNRGSQSVGVLYGKIGSSQRTAAVANVSRLTFPGSGIKHKDLVGIPWMLAFALRTDGWWLRSDIIWSKPNPMPESVTDRPTKAHEYIFLLSKSATYFYDAEAIKEDSISGNVRKPYCPGQVDARGNGHDRGGGSIRKSLTETQAKLGMYRDKQRATGKRTYAGFNERWDSAEIQNGTPLRRNKRTVWEIATSSFPEAHFATFPPALVEPCIKAGTSERGCCPECGAPWERVTESSGGNWEERKANGHPVRYGLEHPKGIALNCMGTPETRTIGWRPTCKCGNTESAPCSVLDPFAGAGTAGLVANHLNRNFIGIELSPEYVIMSINRIENTVITRNGDGRLKCKYAPR